MRRKGQPINADVPVGAPAAPAKEEADPPRGEAPAGEAREQPTAEMAAAAPSPPAATAPSPTAPEPGDAEASPPEAPTKPPAPRRRRPIPTALKAIGALVVIAVVFIVAAIVGGGSPDGDSIPGAAPTTGPTGPTTAAEPPPAQEPSELGYPQFATNNTTRVGGSEPAANAAAVALAAYPSAEESQRPAAVTIASEDDWQTAIAASVLMAEPLGAPLLLTGAEGTPEATAEALDALDPQGAKDTRGAEALVVGGASTPGGLTATTVKGSGAAGAASVARLRDKLLGGPPRHIVVASSTQPAFAMPAAGWAARSGDPVLFTGPRRLPQPTARLLRRHDDVPVYVLGPSSVIPSDLVRQIAEINPDVSRVSGEDPVENAIALARYADGEFGWNVNDPGHGFVVARSDSVLDAAAAAPLSASGTWGPLLLTDSADTLPDALRGYLLDVKPGYTTDPTRAFYNHVWLIGDQDAIDVNQQAEIDELAELARIGGEP